MQAFGYSEAAYYLVPILLSSTLVVATYLLGRMAFGRLVGVAAPAILLTLPWVLPAATRLLPDVGLAALFTGAVTAGDRGHQPSCRARLGSLLTSQLGRSGRHARAGIPGAGDGAPLHADPLVGRHHLQGPAPLAIQRAWPVAVTGLLESLYGWLVWGSRSPT